MKNKIKPQLSLLLSLLLLMACSANAADNKLSDEEKSEGWQLLFNGKDFTDWKMDKWINGTPIVSKSKTQV